MGGSRTSGSSRGNGIGERRHRRTPQHLERALLQCARTARRPGILASVAGICGAGMRFHRTFCLSALSQSMAPDSLAAMDDRSFSRRLARGSSALSYAVSAGSGGQPGSARCRRHRPLHLGCSLPEHRIAGGSDNTGLFRRHSVGLVCGCAAHIVRQGRGDPWLPTVGRAVLRSRRHSYRALDRPSLDRAQFRAATP